MPEGVALKVSAGQTLLLQLHLYNASDATLEGVSGTKVRTTTVDQVTDLAEFFFAGTFSFSIPGNGTDHSATGQCTMSQDAMEPLAVQAGDKVNVTCTWNNPEGNAAKTFGDASEDEMCFGGIYRYPAVGTNFGFCVQ